LKNNQNYLVDIPLELFKKHRVLFQIAPSEVQVDIVWENIGDRWNDLSRNAKILAIYKCAKEKGNTNITSAEELLEKHKGLIQLNHSDLESELKKLHKRIADYRKGLFELRREKLSAVFMTNSNTIWRKRSMSRKLFNLRKG
jgi:hypothetical protein